MSIRARIDKLEAAVRPNKRAYDEICAELMILGRSVLNNSTETANLSPDQRQIVETLERIAAEIREMARRQKSPGYRPEWFPEIADREDYVPALTGHGEFSDPTLPNIMERRAALRALPEIQALLSSV